MGGEELNEKTIASEPAQLDGVPSSKPLSDPTANEISSQTTKTTTAIRTTAQNELPSGDEDEAEKRELSESLPTSESNDSTLQTIVKQQRRRLLEQMQTKHDYYERNNGEENELFDWLSPHWLNEQAGSEMEESNGVERNEASNGVERDGFDEGTSRYSSRRRRVDNVKVRHYDSADYDDADAESGTVSSLFAPGRRRLSDVDEIIDEDVSHHSQDRIVSYEEAMMEEKQPSFIDEDGASNSDESISNSLSVPTTQSLEREESDLVQNQSSNNDNVIVHPFNTLLVAIQPFQEGRDLGGVALKREGPRQHIFKNQSTNNKGGGGGRIVAFRGKRGKGFKRGGIADRWYGKSGKSDKWDYDDDVSCWYEDDDAAFTDDDLLPTLSPSLSPSLSPTIGPSRDPDGFYPTLSPVSTQKQVIIRCSVSRSSHLFVSSSLSPLLQPYRQL